MEWSQGEGDGGPGSPDQSPPEVLLLFHQFVPFPTASQCLDSPKKATQRTGFPDFCGSTFVGGRGTVEDSRGESLEADPARALGKSEDIPCVGHKRKRSRGSGDVRVTKRRKCVKAPAGAQCHVRLLGQGALPRRGKSDLYLDLKAPGVEPLPPAQVRRWPHSHKDQRHVAGTHYGTKPPGRSRKGPASSNWEPLVFVQFTTPQPPVSNAFVNKPTSSATSHLQKGSRRKGNHCRDGAPVGTTSPSQAKRQSRKRNRVPRASSWQRRKQAAAALRTAGTARTATVLDCTAVECTSASVRHTSAGPQPSLAVGGEVGGDQPQCGTMQYHPGPGGRMREDRDAADMPGISRPHFNREVQQPRHGRTAQQGEAVSEADTHTAVLDPGLDQSGAVPRDPKAKRQARKASGKDGALSRDPVLLPRQSIFYLGAFAPSPGLPATRRLPFLPF